MSDVDDCLPVITSSARLDDYPFKALGNSVIARFRIALTGNLKTGVELPTSDERLLKLVEACLCITGLKISSVYSKDFESICEVVIGALMSPKFLEGTESLHQLFTKRFRNCILELHRTDPRIRIKELLFTNPTASTVEALARHRASFEAIVLVDEQVWLWHGWHAKSVTNVSTKLPLYKLYCALGRDFTTRFHECICSYQQGRASPFPPLVKELVQFIYEYPASVPFELRTSLPAELTAENLLQPSVADPFWRGFLVWHVHTAYSKGIKIQTITQLWNGHFRRFIIDHMVPARIFEISTSGLPKLAPNSVPGDRTHIRLTENGQEYRRKLLTDVPIHASDEDALRILFHDIQEDLDIIKKWSQSEVDATNAKVQARSEMAKTGEVRHIQKVGANDAGHKWLTKSSNPQRLLNAAATFQHFGYATESETRISLLYHPRKIIARELGLPVSDVLNPYLNLLVEEHPSITPAFLKSIEIFDKRGNFAGLTLSDNGVATLHGLKRRRGPRLAAQSITLSPNGYALVMQIIELTQPLREYLRNKGDGRWRHLLLSCGAGFGSPKIYRCDPAIPGRIERISERMAEICGISIEKATALAKRTSLPTIRASKGVLIYIETGSIQEMSTALGHEECNELLLTHYLPQSISEFFQERWIRLFQTGIILEALKSSPYRFRAAAFENAKSMDDFLKHHAIHRIDQDGVAEAASKSTVIFNLDLEILTLLASLSVAAQQATLPICPIAKYWVKITRKLFAYIESRQCARPDIRALLREAKKLVDTSLLNGVLYG